MSVPTDQHRGFGRERSKLRKRFFGLLARAHVRVGAREVAMADDYAGTHFPLVRKRLQEGPRWGRQMLPRPYRSHDAGVHAS